MLLLTNILAICLATSAALNIKGNIVQNDVLYDLSLLRQSTKITLNNGQFISYLRKDGSFVLQNVPQGTHFLRVQSNEFQFDIYRIDIVGGKVSASLSLPGASTKVHGPETPYPLKLAPRARYDFFVPRQGFNPLTLLKNPMILMSVGAFVMMFLLPKLTEGMDAQELKEIRDKQIIGTAAQMPDLGANLAAYLAAGSKTSTAGKK